MSKLNYISISEINYNFKLQIPLIFDIDIDF